MTGHNTADCTAYRQRSHVPGLNDLVRQTHLLDYLRSYNIDTGKLQHKQLSLKAFSEC